MFVSFQKYFEKFGQVSLKFKVLEEIYENEEDNYINSDRVILCSRFQIFQTVLKFLSNQHFERILDMNFIKEHYTDQNEKLILADVNDIYYGPDLFTKNMQLEKEQWLNQSVESVAQLLILYIEKQISNNQQLQDQLQLYSGEIKEFVYQSIKFRFKKLYPQQYSKLKNDFQKVFQTFKDQQQMLIDIEMEECIKMFENGSKINIDESWEKFKKKGEKLIAKEIKFNLNSALCFKFWKRIQEMFLFSFQLSIKKYIFNRSINIQFKSPSNLVEKVIFDYLMEGNFRNGLANHQTNQYFQALILSLRWNDIREATLIVKLINNLYQLDSSQCNFNQNANPIDQLQTMSKDKLFLIQQALIWRSKLKDKISIFVIFIQLYLILTNFVYKDCKLQFQIYSPIERSIMIKLMRLLNDNQNEFLNFQILSECEKISHRIEMQIYNQIFNNASQGKLSVNILGKDNNLSEIQLENKEMVAQTFTANIELLMLIYKFPSKNEKAQQKELIQNYLQKLKQKQEYQLQSYPRKLYFEVLSKSDKNSNIITLCISGFLSSKEEKKLQWKDLIEENSGTVIGLHWKSKNVKDCAVYLGALVQSVADQFLENSIQINSIGKYSSQNPYYSANEEAKIVGCYLGQLIARCNLFGGRQLNLICHSLGSIVVQSCIKQLEDLIPFDNKPFINKIIFMGGVADIKDLQSMKFSSVYGGIYNFKSKNDEILKKILSFTKVFDIPCGLNDVQSGYKQIKNYDFTEIINGHSDYWAKLKYVLMRTCLYQEFNLESNI